MRIARGSGRLQVHDQLERDHHFLGRTWLTLFRDSLREKEQHTREVGAPAVLAVIVELDVWGLLVRRLHTVGYHRTLAGEANLAMWLRQLESMDKLGEIRCVSDRETAKEDSAV
jgi:hypothetical protein